MGMFCGTAGLYCICQRVKTGILLLHMFIRGLILNHVSETRWILKFSTSNTNLFLNSSKVSSILLRKMQFWFNNKIILRYI